MNRQSLGVKRTIQKKYKKQLGKGDIKITPVINEYEVI